MTTHATHANMRLTPRVEDRTGSRTALCFVVQADEAAGWDQFQIRVWAACTGFGAGVTIAAIPETGAAPAVMHIADASELRDLLLENEDHPVFVSVEVRGRIVARQQARQWDAAALLEGLEKARRHVIFDDFATHRLIASIDPRGPVLVTDAVERLQVGWALAFRAGLRALIAKHFPADEGPGADGAAARLFNDPEAFARLAEASKESGCKAVALMYNVALLHPSVCAWGQQLVWFNSATRRLDYVRLEPGGFPEWFDPVEYYYRRTEARPGDALGALIGPTDVPVDYNDIARCWSSMPAAPDPAAARESARGLVADGLAHKRWTIPPRARVSVPFGPFVAVELSEIGPAVVAAVFRTGRDEFAPSYLHLDTGAFDFTVPHPDNAVPCDLSRAEAVVASAHLLVAAACRDFWAPAERSDLFDISHEDRAPGPTIAGHASTPPAKRTVYVPKWRRQAREQQQAVCFTNGLERRLRATLPVAGHPRLLRRGTASEARLRLAAEHRIAVGPGETYVSPHTRRVADARRDFRSRSALAALAGVAPVRETCDAAPADTWAAFETAVNQEIGRRGWTVQSRTLPATGTGCLLVEAKDGARTRLVLAVPAGARAGSGDVRALARLARERGLASATMVLAFCALPGEVLRAASSLRVPVATVSTAPSRRPA